MLTLPTPAQLKAHRVRLGLTQQEVADRAGVSQSLIARVEGGGVDPSYSTVRAIVEVLNEAERQEAQLTELMSTPVVSVAPADPVREAVTRMRSEGFSQLPVLDDGVPVGSLSERDIVHALTTVRREELSDRAVESVMGAPFPAVDPTTAAASVLNMLEEHPAVLIMEKGRVTGIVTKTNLLEHLG